MLTWGRQAKNEMFQPPGSYTLLWAMRCWYGLNTMTSVLCIWATVCGKEAGEGPQLRSAPGEEEGVTLKTLDIFIVVRNQREMENNEREKNIFTSVNSRSSVLFLQPLRILQPSVTDVTRISHDIKYWGLYVCTRCLPGVLGIWWKISQKGNRKKKKSEIVKNNPWAPSKAQCTQQVFDKCLLLFA